MHAAMRSKLFVPLVIALGLAPAAYAQTHTTTFTNNTPNALPGAGTSGPAATYPANLVVAGVTGVTYHVSVRLNVTHTFAADLAFLLVAPSGLNVMVMASAGSDANLTNTNLVFDDCAPRALRNGSAPAVSPGRYRPSGGGVPRPALTAPAPAGPYGNELSTFNWVGPNGTWQLFAFDMSGGDVGTLNSWSLTIFDQPGSPLPASGELNPVSCTAPDYDGDGRTDVAVYRPLTGEWFIAQSGSSGALQQLSWGAPSSFGTGDIQVPADYDGDGITDLAVYRQTTGEWFIRRSFDLSLLQVSFGAPSSFGLADTPVPGDYDGDGQADIAIYRAGTGQWFLRSSAGLGVTVTSFGFPPAGDTPARR